MSVFSRAAAVASMAAAILVLGGCASSGKPVATVEEKPITVTVEAAPAADKDALGNYRFLMQQDGVNMSADQFDAWMKANGIRVAKGNGAPSQPVVVAGKDEPQDKKKKKK